VLVLFVLLAAVLPAAAASAATPPPVKHVFVVVLENKDQAKTFAADSPAPYLAHTLRQRGQYLPNYFGVTHFSLGNYIAMVSGQGSNPQTQADCQFFTDFAPGVIGPDGQAMGQGCVYPSSVKTVADQLDERGLGWKGYMEDMGNDPGREPATCGHPALNTQDKTQTAKKGDQYAARHNPFVYFHSIIDRPACAANDVPLTRLEGDLAANRVGAFTFITPNLCHDGHDTPCVDGEPGGLKSPDAFLRTLIPKITASRAYHDGGLIVVTFDESEKGAEACCNEPQFPNTANNGGTTTGRGGGQVGAVILSSFVKPGSVNPTPYNHFALLRSVEDIFGLPHLGYAARADLKAFGSDVYNAPVVVASCRDRTRPTLRYALGGIRGSSRTIDLRGTAADDGCAGSVAAHTVARRGAVRSVRFAVSAFTPGGCRFVGVDGRLTPTRSCRRPLFLTARGTGRWQLRVRGRFPHGRYVVRSRVYDAAGNIGRPAPRTFRIARVRPRFAG